MTRNASRLLTGIVTTAVFLIGGIGLAAPAGAAINTSIQPQTANQAQAFSDYSLDASCLAQVQPQAISRGLLLHAYDSVCVVKTISMATAPSVVTPEAAQAAAGLSASAKAELTAAASIGAVRSKSWEIDKVGITYYEVMKGRFYYDGTKAWSTTTYRGTRGSQQCQAAGSWGITVNVEVVSCTSNSPGSSIVDRETYKVQAAFSGSPINWTLAMSELSTANGSTSARSY